jgi:chromosome segregation ATPase
MSGNTSSNEIRVDGLEHDLFKALRRLAKSKEDFDQLTNVNLELQKEIDILVTEIQEVLDENEDCQKQIGPLKVNLFELKCTNSGLLQEHDAVLETLQVQNEEQLKGVLSKDEVEEIVQQARTEELSRIEIMFGEQHRMQSAMVQMEQQKDRLEQEIDRLQGLLLQRHGSASRSDRRHSNIQTQSSQT